MRFFMYRQDCPRGRIFECKDEDHEDLVAELEDDGWKDSPAKVKGHHQYREPDTDQGDAPQISDFEDVDSFMEAYTHFYAITGKSGQAIAKRKEGLELYARERHQVELDRRKSLQDLYDEVVALDHALNSEPA